MKAGNKSKCTLENITVDVKIKISALWVVLMLIYLYVDVFGFYKPGVIAGILDGKIWKFEITQMWALASLILMMIPGLMVFLSLLLKARPNRLVNIILAAVYIVVGVATTVGETWAFYIVGHVVGILLLGVIIGYALKWPRTDAS